jgi:YtkA-like protein
VHDFPHRLALVGALLATAVGGACGSGGSGPAQPSLDFSGPAALTLASTSGQLNVGVRWSPNPPALGFDAAELTLTGTDGAPAGGLTLTVLPWMPAHGHGTSTMPGVTETTPGVYVATPIDFYMAGQWELRTTIVGAADDMVTPAIELQ